jgi:hypothetical protein
MNAIKFNSYGAIQWQTQNYISTTYGGGPAQMALDGSNNIYAFGTFNTAPPGEQGGYRKIIAKWNSSGNLQWSKKLRKTPGAQPDNTCSGGTLNTSSQPIAAGRSGEGVWPSFTSVDTSGNSRYIKVFYSDGSDNFHRSRFDNSGFIISGSTAGSGGRGKVCKISDTSTNDAGGWNTALQANYGSEGVDYYDVTLSASSSATSVWFVGSKWRSMAIPEGIVAELTSTNTTSPSASWMNSFSANQAVYLTAIHYDSVKNKIYATGYSTVSSIDEGIIIKMSTNGTVDWIRKFSVSSGASTYYTYISSVKTDSTGQIYLSGYYNTGNNVNKPMLISMPTSGAKTGNKTIGALTISYSTKSLTITARSPSLGGGFSYNFGGTPENENLSLGSYAGPLSSTGTTTL